jgi:hypothetical protein
LHLDPLTGIDDPSKPLRSRVLAVPRYREAYLEKIRQIAEEALDWQRLGPFVDSQLRLIDPLVKSDTRKLGTYEAFVALTRSDSAAVEDHRGGRGGHGAINLKQFCDGRRDYLLSRDRQGEPR